MRIWEVIYFLATIYTAGFGVYIYGQNRQETANKIYSVLCALLSFLTFLEIQIYTANSEGEVFVWTVMLQGWPLLMGLLVHFSSEVSGRNGSKRNILIPVYAVCFLLVGIGMFNSGTLVEKMVQLEWGWLPVLKPSWCIVCGIYVVLTGALSVWFVGNSYWREREGAKAKQMTVVILAITIVPINLAVQYFHKAFFSQDFSIPMPYALPNLLSMAIIGYGMKRYRLFSITQEEVMRHIVTSLTDPLFLLGPDRKVRHANTSAANLLGFRASEIHGRLFDSVYLAQPTSESVNGALLKSNTGVDIPVETSVSELVVNDVTLGTVVICRDVTDKKQIEKEKDDLQRQLVQSAKLASIGTLSAGIAHELNNPLTAVLGFAQRIAESPALDAKDKGRTQQIIEAAKRMRKITDQLRTFSRKSVSEDWHAVRVHEIIQKALMLLEQPLNLDDIAVQLNLSAENDGISGDDVQLESVFQNLIVNSRDAFRDVKDDRKKVIKFGTQIKNGALVIQYEDNACGMSEQTLAQMFDPFFTTKDVGVGTGLGMSITYGVIKQHKGLIRASSKLGIGTRFELSLPLTTDRTTTDSDSNVIPLNGKTEGRENKRILIVDDDILITSLLQDYLSEFYQLEVTNDSVVAMDLLDREKFDLVLTDLMMPKVTGKEIIRKVQGLVPAIPVILMTASVSEEDLDRGIVEFQDIEILHKPFQSPAEVKITLQKALKTLTIEKKAA